MRGLFVTGADTGVGKTFVACGIIRELHKVGVRVGAYKPACSGALVLPDGNLDWSDVAALADATGYRFPRERVCPQCFAAPLAPPRAAIAEGRTVDADLLRTGLDWWSSRVDTLIVEGAGGLLSPLADGVTNADFAHRIRFPVLVVAANRLGCINHTLLTVEAAQSRGLTVAGVVLSQLTPIPDESCATNVEDLSRGCSVPILGVWPFGSDRLLRPATAGTKMDWQALIDA